MDVPLNAFASTSILLVFFYTFILFLINEEGVYKLGCVGVFFFVKFCKWLVPRRSIFFQKQNIYRANL